MNFLIVVMNSRMNELSSSGEISSTALDSPFSIKNYFWRAIFCSVFSLGFPFSCPSMNSSTETIFANLEVAEDDAITLLFFLVDRSRQGKAGKPIRFFSPEEVFVCGR